MSVRQMVISTADGGHTTLAVPEPVTLEAIEVLEQASALMLRSLRRNALTRSAGDAGAIEYDSWSTGSGHAGAVEYDSWSANFRQQGDLHG